MEPKPENKRSFPTPEPLSPDCRHGENLSVPKKDNRKMPTVFDFDRQYSPLLALDTSAPEYSTCFWDQKEKAAFSSFSLPGLGCMSLSSLYH